MKPKSKTLSASVPQAVYQQTRDIVRQEQRRQSAVIADALRLYSFLTPAARRVMEQLRERYGAGARGKVQAELSRALLRAQWEIVAEETARQIPADLAQLSDQDLMRAVDEEVAATRRSRAGS